MEIDGLRALNVFVDSSIFIGKNYNYDNPSFTALKEAVVNERVNLLTTDVTLEEIKAHIHEDLGKASQALKKVRASVKILRNLPAFNETNIFEDIDQKSVCKELVEQLTQFLNESKVTTVPVAEADTKYVFDCYFKKAPPFGDGKKKSEFPDAFVLSTLSEWAESMQEDVFVVSQDSDMLAIEGQFPRLSAVSSLEEVLSKVTSYFDELAPTAQKLLGDNLEEIESQLGDAFNLLGFILADQDGDVNETRIIEIGEISAYLIALKHGEIGEPAEAQFELTTTVEFEADVSYDDLETASYDSEDKVLIPWETVDRTVECSEVVQADLTILFNATQPQDAEIEKLNLHTPKDISVYAEEDDGWPYK